MDGHYELSTDDIWGAVVSCLQTVTAHVVSEHQPKANVVAAGIDATCSLVACLPDKQLSPLPITPSSLSQSSSADVHNVLLWLDCRTTAEAAEISAFQHPAV